MPDWQQFYDVQHVLDHLHSNLERGSLPDGTLDPADQFGCPAIVAHNPTTRAQYIVEVGSRAFSTPWAPRIGDDEIPSRAMLSYIDGILGGLAPQRIVGFPRHQWMADAAKAAGILRILERPAAA